MTVNQAAKIAVEILFYELEKAPPIPLDKISYGVLRKNTRSWGETSYNQRTGEYYIELKQELLNSSNEHPIITTMIHEMLHCIPGGMSHTGAWKKWADYISENTEYNISRTNDDNGLSQDQVDELDRQAKLVLRCVKCGTKYRYFRIRKDLKWAIDLKDVGDELEGYHCGNSTCKGQIIIDKLPD